MSIKLRLAILLGLLLTGFAAGMVALRLLERGEKERALDRDRKSHEALLDQTIGFGTMALSQYATSLAESAEFAAVVARGQPDEIQVAAAASLTVSGMTALWILEIDGRPRVTASAANVTEDMRVPFEPAEIVALTAERSRPGFFVERDGQLAEVCLRPLERGKGEWLLVMRRWDEQYLRRLATLMQGKVVVSGLGGAGTVSGSGMRVVLTRPLNGWRGELLRSLEVEFAAADFEDTVRTDRMEATVLVALGVLILGAVTLAIHGWVLRPLSQVGDSLATNRPQLVEKLSHEKSEFGRVAQLVQSSFEQREILQKEVQERTLAQAARQRSEAALRANLEERSKLGRDLHDGVIQSLYAAGMGLAGVRGLLRPEQTEAIERIEQSQEALNETIHDVRNFLIGLEPEALKLQSFAQAVGTLLDLMQGVRSFHRRVEIDENLAACLTLAQRVHALQVAREAVSNALRHGEAGVIGVALRAQDKLAEFEVSDDGQGFDPRLRFSGRGLVNFAERARELGASLSVESELGLGSRVRLTFPFPRHD